MSQVVRVLRFARRIAEGIARRLVAMERRIVPDAPRAFDRTSHAAAVVHVMNEYDTLTQPDEPYYARQYLHFILPELERRFPDCRTTILDLGCGQGRLSLPLAQWAAVAGGTVTGVDLTPAAVAQARRYAESRHVRNVSFVHRDAVEFVREVASASVDAVVLAEVTVFMPSYREVLKELDRLLKPGGVAFIAFRSQYYNQLQLVSRRKWESAKRCVTEREGYIFGGDIWYGWQTVQDIHQLLAEVGLHVARLLGIGVFSGLEGDARGAIIHPAQLSSEDQKGLMEVECAAAVEYAACGRYILTVAERKANV